MMEQFLFYVTIFLSFLITYFLTKIWIKTAKQYGLVGKDMNKHEKPEIPEAGGVAVVIGFCFALLSYIFIQTFYFGNGNNIVFVFSLITAVLLTGFIGFIDDILGWKVGIKQKHKFLLTIPMTIPIIVVNAGQSIMNVPFLGTIDFGILYPLLIVPIGIVGATNGFNLLAGFNGLETGMGIIILSTLGYVVWVREIYWLFFIILMCIASLLGFFIFNKYPSKIFPGDTLTYTLGATIAIVAIFGNMEKIALILFFPYILELVLKLRSGLRAECFGIPDENNLLIPPSQNSYSLAHIIMKYLPKIFHRNLKETEVVLFLYAFEILIAFCVILFLL